MRAMLRMRSAGRRGPGRRLRTCKPYAGIIVVRRFSPVGLLTNTTFQFTILKGEHQPQGGPPQGGTHPLSDGMPFKHCTQGLLPNGVCLFRRCEHTVIPQSSLSQTHTAPDGPTISLRAFAQHMFYIFTRPMF